MYYNKVAMKFYFSGKEVKKLANVDSHRYYVHMQLCTCHMCKNYITSIDGTYLLVQSSASELASGSYNYTTTLMGQGNTHTH